MTIARNGWAIEGATANLTLNTAGLTRAWLFRGDTGNWARAQDLALTDPSPLPAQFDAALAIILADRLQPVLRRSGSPADAAAADALADIINRSRVVGQGLVERNVVPAQREG